MPYGRRGGELVVNQKTVGNQYAPSIAGFASGGFIVVWDTNDPLQDGAGKAIKAQRYDSLGNAVGLEILVNSSGAGEQRTPSVTTLASGGWVVTWETTDTTQDGSGLAIKGQLFDSAGAPVGSEFRVNSQLAADQITPSVTGLDGGGFVVTWRTNDSTQDGSGGAIKGQIYSAAGVAVGGEFLVNTGAVGGESQPAVTSLAGGGFVATWTLESGGPYAGDIYAQIFTSSGAKSGGQFLVNSTTALSQTYASISQISGGRFVVTWESTASTTLFDKEIRARIFNSDGTPIGSDFLVSTSRFDPGSGLRLANYQPSVDDLPGGGFVITWTHSYGMSFRSSTRAQFFDSNGNRVGSEVVVSTVTNRFEERGDVAVDGNGMVFAVWGSYNESATDADIRGQLFGPGGAPAIVSNGGADVASVTVAENQSAVATVAAVDPEGAGLVYSIAAGTDAAFFAINASTGILTFVSAPSYEWMLDWDNNGTYEVVVSVSDGVMTDIQALTVTVSNVNEAPVIAGGQTNYSRVENGTAVATFSATDPEGTAVTWSIAGGADAARFAIDAATGALRFVAAPDFEAPGDAGADNFYNVTIAAGDGSLSATRALTIAVTNSNEAPVITSNGGGSAAAIAVTENGLAVTNVAAADPEGIALSYAISGGADASRFLIDSATGALRFATAPNHEQPADSDGNNVYEVVVRASDGTFTDTQALSITVGNANEGVVITSAASITAYENFAEAGTVAATDLDGDAVSFAIAGGADGALFEIDAITGALSFLAAPDHEAPADADGDNVYEVAVSASDGSLSDVRTLSVTVEDDNEPLAFVSGGGGDIAAVTIAENTGWLFALEAEDPEGQVVAMGIAGGADAALFAYDSQTRMLRFVGLPNYEAPGDADGDNVYELVVGAYDGLNFDYQTIFVTVANVYEGISFGGSSVTLGVDENVIQAGVVAAVSGDGAELTYTITGGEDSPLFSIDPTTGAISFEVAPDYEAPRDSNWSNDYRLTVTASDGTHSSSQFVTVVVGNVDEGIELLSYEGDESVALSVAENDGSAGQVEARDLDGDPVTYSIAGGADAAQFAVDAATGALSFLEGADFENPSDSGGDNIYDVVVAASSGGSTATQAFAVSVTNRNDGIFITSNGGDNSAGLTFEEGTSLVTTVVAHDPDGTIPVYSIIGGNDASRFTIDPATGVLSFVEAPDYETPLDIHGANIYAVIVAASDGELSSWQYLSVLITNVNEAVTITSGGGAESVAVTIAEDQSVVADVDAVDADGTTIFYSIAGGADAAFFGIDLLTGELRILGADHDVPGDSDGDNVYEVIVAADDGWLSDTQAFSVTLADVDEPLYFTSYNSDFYVSLAVGENSLDAALVAAEDPEGAAVVYSIVDSYDGASFTIDAQTGALRFLAAPSYEAPADLDGDNVYTVLVAATDGSFFDYQTISIQVGDVNESVAITSDGGGAGATVWTTENGTAVTVVAASDPDGGPVTYAIAGGVDAALFTIDSSTGALAFVAAPDFESTRGAGGSNDFYVTVSASDGSSTDSQSLTVILENVVEGLFITSYGGAESVSVTLTEGYPATYDVDSWDDVEVFAPIVYSISGADAAFFTIDNQGRFSFDYDAPPNFEGPADADGDNVYEVTVTASISTFSDSQAFSITVVNRDENVVFTSHDGEPIVNLTVAENGTAVTTVSAVDPEGEAVSYAIAGGADAAFFTIDSSTGVLAFAAAPDFENNTDAWGNNIYRVIVTATDGIFINSQFFFVTVGNVDESPVITSGGGGGSAAVTVNENGLAVTSLAASDSDGNPLSWSIAGGADASRFTIDSSSGALCFVQAPNFEAPGDVGGDNVYDVVVSVTDGALTDSQAVAVTVANLAENVTIISNSGGAGASVTVAENSAAVTVVAAVDPDGAPVTYAIAGGADAARFTIDPGTGALAFAAAPDFEAYQDSDGDNVYDVIVAASDGSSTDSQSLAVTVGNVDEPVEILSYGGASAVALTLTEGGNFSVATVEADDAEDWTITYAITGGADAALFRVNAYTGVLDFDYGIYPDFEAPADAGGDNVYDVVVTASSSTSSADQAFAFTVADRNEGLWITSNGGGDANLTMNEGDRDVTIVTAEDQDGDVPTYSIVGGADSALFAIDAVTGALTFIAAPDYEAPSSGAGTNVYLVQVGASDGEFLGTQSIRIEIGNVNERPVITHGGGGESAAVTVNENGLAVTTIAASDPDGNPLTWSIVGGADASRFTIESWSGALRFVQGPNYEAPGDAGGNNVYDVVVSVTDGVLTDSQSVAVTVANLAEIVTITSNGGGAGASVTVAENGTAVTTVAASSPDGGVVTYAIAGGADSARFTINASTGALAFVAAPNYEAPADAGANNVYDVVVSASNGATVDTQALAVTVSNVNEQMAIASNGGGASAAVSVAENSIVVTTVVGVDPDGAPVTYVILHGGDSGLFSIDSTTGVLAFRAAPNFEAPGDSNGDNVYTVTVMASDGLWSDDQTIIVTVGNVAEAPVITSGGGGASGSVSVAENSLAVAIVAATDPDGTAATYSIVGGADAARFTINAQTGALQFVAAPDWELPADSNQDNVYAVVVRASDGQLADDQALNVTVGNVRDGNNVTGTSAGDTISATSTNVALRTSNEEDLVFGRGGHDNISGMAGDDELYGEDGNDVLIGGEGADKLLGGLGKDTFTYNSVSESTGAARDLIMDFSRSQADKISLSAIDSNSVSGGNQAFAFIGTSAFSGTPGQLRYETSGGMTTVFGDVNGDGVADLQIQLSGSIALVASDFVL